MLQVYLDPCTVNSRKVLAGLDLLGTQYKLNHVDYFTGAHKRPEFLAINPNGAASTPKIGELSQLPMATKLTNRAFQRRREITAAITRTSMTRSYLARRSTSRPNTPCTS